MNSRRTVIKLNDVVKTVECIMSSHECHLVDANVHIHDAPDGGADELQVADPVVLLLGGHEGDVEVTQVVVHSPTPAVTSS